MEQERLSIQDYRALSSSWQCSPDKLEKVTTDDLKKLLAEYVLSEQSKNAIIGELKRREPDFEYASVNPEDALANIDKSYPAVSIIAGVIKLLGWILIIGGVFGFFQYLHKNITLRHYLALYP